MAVCIKQLSDLLHLCWRISRRVAVHASAHFDTTMAAATHMQQTRRCPLINLVNIFLETDPQQADIGARGGGGPQGILWLSVWGQQ